MLTQLLAELKTWACTGHLSQKQPTSSHIEQANRWLCLYMFISTWEVRDVNDVNCFPLTWNVNFIPICISPVPKSCCNIWQTCNYEYIQCNYVSVIKKKLPGVGSAVCPHPKKEASSFKVSSLWPVGWWPACNHCLTTNLRATKNISTTYHLLYYIISAIYLP